VTGLSHCGAVWGREALASSAFVLRLLQHQHSFLEIRISSQSIEPLRLSLIFHSVTEINRHNARPNQRPARGP
jgi:hypothetical protein